MDKSTDQTRIAQSLERLLRSEGHRTVFRHDLSENSRRCFRN